MIFKYKTQLMEYILLLVSRGGYRYWTSGVVPLKKWQAFELKMIDRYQIDRDEQQRYRARKKGLANTQLLAYPRLIEKETVMIDFWLIVDTHSPDCLVWQLEKLTDIEKTRITIGLDYELVQTPRKGKPPQWTWRMIESRYQEWRKDIQEAIRKRKNMRLRQLHHELIRVPGFHEIRRQAFALQSFLRSEWIRSRGRNEEVPARAFVSFVGRKKALALLSFDEVNRSASK
jgi:hypothetical protein